MTDYEKGLSFGVTEESLKQFMICYGESSKYSFGCWQLIMNFA